MAMSPDSAGRWPEKQQIEDSEDAKKKWSKMERERGETTRVARQRGETAVNVNYLVLLFRKNVKIGY